MRKERKGEKINLFREHIKKRNQYITGSMHGSSVVFTPIHGNVSTGGRKGWCYLAGLPAD